MVLNVTLCAQYVIKDNKKGLRFKIHLFVCLFSWTRQFKHKLSDLDFPACLCDQLVADCCILSASRPSNI